VVGCSEHDNESLGHIKDGCPCCDDKCVTFCLHGTLCGMLRDYHGSVSNMLSFLSGIGLAKAM
jgi:hypothetical protein